jgi:glyoxylase-like metal-dependent hydrolase (beta-lactamase superfamily II)
VVIDPGLGRRNGEAVLREVAKVSSNDELYVASTHFHPEHTTGYVAFPDEAQYVNSSIQEAEFAENGQRMIQLFAGRTPVMGDLLRDAERRMADITFEREHTLDLGGVTVHLLVVGPTHTRGDTGFFVEEDDVLFAGDVVMNSSFLAANQGSSVMAWLAAFDAFEAMGPQTIVPAHGEIGDGTLIPTQRAIMRGIRARARELKARGRTADETATTILAELRAEHPGWPRSNGVAALARAAWLEAGETQGGTGTTQQPHTLLGRLAS